MKKILGVSLVALMAVSTARADIVSKAYVDVDQTKTYNVITKTAKTGAQIEELDAKMGALPSNKTIAEVITEAVTGGTENVVTHSGAVGSATTPVYITEQGVATAGNALGTAAALDSTTTIAENGTGLPTAGTVYTALAAKADASDLSSYELKSNVTSKGSATNPVYFDENGVATAITSYPYANLTGTPTVDATPTENSTNAVQSGGVYTALAGKQDTIAAGTYVATVSTDSNGGNVVTAVSANTNGTVSVTTGNAIMETSATGTDGVSVLTRTVDGTTGAVTYKWETIQR